VTNRFSRQILAFGEEVQRRLSATRAGIIGLGGIGSQVAQQLAYLGVGNFLLVDDDVVEDSNLNRLVGALPGDAFEKSQKVAVAERMITGINPEATVMKLPLTLTSEVALRSLTQVDYLFGCVDNDSARFILTYLAAACEIPLIDSAFEIFVEKDRISDFGGRVVLAYPGEFCLMCANQIDTERAKVELESPQEREYREKHGYGLGNDIPAPAVISLNTIIAGLAVSEFLLGFAGVRYETYNKLTYKGMRGMVSPSRDTKKEDCIICNSMVGKKEAANLERFVVHRLPADLPI
jgi:hypothetical protein